MRSRQTLTRFLALAAILVLTACSAQSFSARTATVEPFVDGSVLYLRNTEAKPLTGAMLTINGKYVCWSGKTIAPNQTISAVGQDCYDEQGRTALQPATPGSIERYELVTIEGTASERFTN